MIVIIIILIIVILIIIIVVIVIIIYVVVIIVNYLFMYSTPEYSLRQLGRGRVGWRESEPP